MSSSRHKANPATIEVNNDFEKCGLAVPQSLPARTVIPTLLPILPPRSGEGRLTTTRKSVRSLGTDGPGIVERFQEVDNGLFGLPSSTTS